jgi:hypothetical protein
MIIPPMIRIHSWTLIELALLIPPNSTIAESGAIELALASRGSEMLADDCRSIEENQRRHNQEQAAHEHIQETIDAYHLVHASACNDGILQHDASVITDGILQ